VATLYVAEYRQLASVPSSSNFAPIPGQAPQEPPMAEQVVAISGSSTASVPFGGYTAMVRIHCDVVCSIAFNTVQQAQLAVAPIATTSNKRLAAGQTEYFGTFPNQQIAVIANV
jgi:hypothetical protein